MQVSGRWHAIDILGATKGKTVCIDFQVELVGGDGLSKLAKK